MQFIKQDILRSALKYVLHPRSVLFYGLYINPPCIVHQVSLNVFRGQLIKSFIPDKSFILGHCWLQVVRLSCCWGWMDGWESYAQSSIENDVLLWLILYKHNIKVWLQFIKDRPTNCSGNRTKHFSFRVWKYSICSSTRRHRFRCSLNYLFDCSFTKYLCYYLSCK